MIDRLHVLALSLMSSVMMSCATTNSCYNIVRDRSPGDEASHNMMLTPTLYDDGVTECWVWVSLCPNALISEYSINVGYAGNTLENVDIRVESLELTWMLPDGTINALRPSRGVTTPVRTVDGRKIMRQEFPIETRRRDWPQEMTLNVALAIRSGVKVHVVKQSFRVALITFTPRGPFNC